MDYLLLIESDVANEKYTLEIGFMCKVNAYNLYAMVCRFQICSQALKPETDISRVANSKKYVSQNVSYH